MSLPETKKTDAPAVLIVDDNVDLCELLAFLLTDEGFQVRTAFSGEKAFEYLAADHYDLLLADYQLPDVTGNEIIASVHQAGKGVRTILISASPHVDELAARCHADGCFMKGKPIGQLVSDIKLLMQKAG